jgi:hypothetical protein
MTQYLWMFSCAVLESFELTYRQNKYATLTGVQDVFQICEISPCELHRYAGGKGLTYCHSLGKLMIQSQRTTVSIQAYISVIDDSIYKIKVLTHCFERSEE